MTRKWKRKIENLEEQILDLRSKNLNRLRDNRKTNAKIDEIENYIKDKECKKFSRLAKAKVGRNIQIELSELYKEEVKTDIDQGYNRGVYDAVMLIEELIKEDKL